MRLEPAALRSRVKHSTTGPLRSLQQQRWNKQQRWNQQQDQQQHRNTIKDALRGNLSPVTLYTNVRDKYDMLIFFASTKAEIVHYIMQYLVERRGLIYYFNLQVKCNKEKHHEKIYTSAHFWSNSTIVLNNDHVEIDLSEAHQKIFKSFDAHGPEGSGWVFDEVAKIDVR